MTARADHVGAGSDRPRRSSSVPTRAVEQRDAAHSPAARSNTTRPSKTVASTRSSSRRSSGTVSRSSLEHDDVGGHSRCQPSQPLLREARVSGPARDAGQRLRARQALLGMPAARWLLARVAARDVGVEAQQRVGQLHRRVAAAAQAHAAVQQRAPGVGARRARDRGALRPKACRWSQCVGCIEAMTPSSREARHVRGRQYLRVLDAEPRWARRARGTAASARA